LFKRLDLSDASHYIEEKSHNKAESSHKGEHIMPSYKDIWAKLSQVDVSKHVQKKGHLSYLSWAWAWGTLMEHYPNAKYISAEKFYPDGSCEVRIDMDIDGCDRHMWLAVMDHVNKAIPNPDARAISDSKMRCLVKVLAMFGLGHYIYAGEDTPTGGEGTEETIAKIDFNAEKLVSRPAASPVKTTSTFALGTVDPKAPVDAKLFSFTAPTDLSASDASAKQMGYLRSLLVKGGHGESAAFDEVGEGHWPSKESVSTEINALLGKKRVDPAPATVTEEEDDLPF